MPVYHLRIGGDQLLAAQRSHPPVCPAGGETATTGPTLTTQRLATQPTAGTGLPVPPTSVTTALIAAIRIVHTRHGA